MVWIVQKTDSESCDVVAVFESMGDAFAHASQLFVDGLADGRNYTRQWFDVFEMAVRPRDPDNDNVTRMVTYEDLEPGPRSRLDEITKRLDAEEEAVRVREAA